MTVAAGGALSAGQTTVLLTAAEAQEAMKRAGSLANADRRTEARGPASRIMHRPAGRCAERLAAHYRKRAARAAA
jgi:hypothetical protein